MRSLQFVATFIEVSCDYFPVQRGNVMFVLACFSKILDETVGGLISGANEKYKEWRTLNGVESAITDFNEEFSDSALDSGVFSKFINTNEKVKLYFKRPFNSAN